MTGLGPILAQIGETLKKKSIRGNEYCDCEQGVPVQDDWTCR